MKSVEEQVEIIRQGTVDVVPEDLLREKIKRSIATGEPLIVKQGYDPTAPDIHLGHVVCLRKLRHFQDIGHSVVFLIGDFTGMIGDPSGKNETRKRMSREELLENAETYKKQAFKILNPDRTTIDFNSRWLSKLSFAEVLDLAATQTIARIIERDDFYKRFKNNQPISLLEFIYPLAQAYDSVALKADVELGGTEQKFNLLMAREVQKAYGQEPQVIVTMPILKGTDGEEKMSKSLGNYIGITEFPENIFGKTMSISDSLIFHYFELVSTKGPKELIDIKRRLEDPATNPSHLKRELAKDLVTQFYGEDAAAKAETQFNSIHVRKEQPDDMDMITLKGEADGLWIAKALAQSELCDSTSQARRMIQQGAVSVDGEKVSDLELRLESKHAPYVIKVGKRKFLKIMIE